LSSHYYPLFYHVCHIQKSNPANIVPPNILIMMSAIILVILVPHIIAFLSYSLMLKIQAGLTIVIYFVSHKFCFRWQHANVIAISEIIDIAMDYLPIHKPTSMILINLKTDRIIGYCHRVQMYYYVFNLSE
jgi:hypothetical protein